jgi:hypothetical protein
LTLDPVLVEAIRTATGSLGGGGRADLILAAPGGGARFNTFGFGVATWTPVRPAAESMPAPPAALCFTLILMVSPSYRPIEKYLKI